MTTALRFTQPSGKMALSIAAFMARPMHHLSPPVLEKLLGQVNGHDLRPMAQSKLAQGVVERYLADRTGSLKLDTDPKSLDLLRSNQGALQGLELALAPFVRP